MNSPDLVVVGLSHKTAPVAVRERLAFPSERTPEALTRLRAVPGCMEGVILSTCNRVEIYVASDQHACGDGLEVESVKQFLADFHDRSARALDGICYAHSGGDGVRHLFGVASGLDSMVVGEGEVLRQVRGAYEAAHAAGATSRWLNRLFQRAAYVGKLVRTETQIARGAVSVGSVGVELARRIFKDLSQKRVLLIGAGELGELAAMHLTDHGVGRMLVANRSWERGCALAERFRGDAVAFDHRWEAMTEADIVIASTSASSWIVTRFEVEALMRQRRGRPLFLIDLSVPRNIEPSVNAVENAYLYDIDDLQTTVEANLAMRRSELNRAWRLVEAEAAAFYAAWSMPVAGQHGLVGHRVDPKDAAASGVGVHDAGTGDRPVSAAA